MEDKRASRSVECVGATDAGRRDDGWAAHAASNDANAPSPVTCCCESTSDRFPGNESAIDSSIDRLWIDKWLAADWAADASQPPEVNGQVV